MDLTENKEPLALAESRDSSLSPTSMSVPIKRPTRTYGRPKDLVSDEPRSTLLPTGSALTPATATHNAIASRFTTKLPERFTLSRQWPQPDVADDQASDDEADDAPNFVQFSWKAKLKAMDEETYVGAGESEDRDTGDASNAPHLSPRDPPKTVPTSPSPVAQDVFTGSLSTIAASSVAPEAFANSPPPAKPKRRRVKNRNLVDSSDEDSVNDTKSSAQKPLHSITSPTSRRSSTPPTSDDEMPLPARLASTTQSKGKPSSSRAKVPRLRFEEVPAANHRKRPSESSKNKAPTKKELKETARDRGRIAGGQRAGVQQAETTNRFTVANFFRVIHPNPVERTSSDPIISFSSSPADHRAAPLDPPPEFDHENEEVAAPSSQPVAPPPTMEIPTLDSDNSDNEELPDVNDLLSEVKLEEKKRELRQKKLMLLAAKPQEPVLMEDDDDDLEIIKEARPKTVIVDRGSASKQRTSEGRKRQLVMGGISLAQQQQRAKQSKTSTPPKIWGTTGMTQDELKRHMAKLVADRNAEMTKQKEDEWKKRGGAVMEVTTRDAAQIEALNNAALRDIVERGEINAAARESRMQVDLDDDDDADDEDWVEERGSMSPRPRRDSDADVEEDPDITMVNEEDGEEKEEDEDENEAPVHRSVRRARAVIDSDSENEENVAPVRKSASIILRNDVEDGMLSPIELGTAHRDSTCSLDEDEGDKENNTHLMYDRSDDKENKAVPRHPQDGRPVFNRKVSSMSGLVEGMERALSMSPGNPEPMSDGEIENQDENENPNPNNAKGDGYRPPLQNLLAEDPFSVPSSGVDFAARLQQASASAEEPILSSPTSTLQPSFEAGVRFASKPAFSQFSDDESLGSVKGAALEPGFPDLFESTAPKQPLALSASFTEKAGALFAPRGKNVSLGLTQDVDLQPAFEVGDRLKRQADEVFEKEQEYVWAAAHKKAETKQELYVNDHGFLTQTRPEGEEPEVYRPSALSQARSFSFSATQRSGVPKSTPSVLRRPLSTLSMSDVNEPMGSHPPPLQRLVKRARTPSPSPSSPRSESPIRARNAFDVLGQKAKAPRLKKPMLEKSEFVAEEAQESDDDEMLGFGQRRGDDGEEEEGEDMDRTLATLVDDQEMDQETIAADRVLEKFQEHAHEDDLENEKLQQAVVAGELRKKRRNRGLLDDSDDEDEEDEARARKMRRGLNAPRLGAEVTEYAKHDETRAFFHVYQDELDGGDNAEFAYLQQQTQTEPQDEEMGSDDDGEVLTRKELEEKMRQVAREEQAAPIMDVHDVSWMDQDDSDGEQPKQKLTSRRRGQQARNLGLEVGRLEGWAKLEMRHSRNAGTGRTSGRNAVTGQNSRAKTGGGSLRTASAPTPVEAARKPIKAQPSVLAGVVSDRSSRFVL